MGRTDVVPKLSPTEEEWDAFLHRLTRWAEGRQDIHGLAIMGSRARTDRQADAWSDLDVFLIVDAAEPFVDDTAWLDEIASWWTSLDHDAPIAGLRVRQTIFEHAIDVDFVPMPTGMWREVLADDAVKDLVAKGFRPVLDKAGVFAAVPGPEDAPPVPELDAARFTWVVSDFLFQIVWATKHLRRGELWLAKSDVDGYMKEGLLKMIEWLAAAEGWGMATWAGSRSGGRLLETWVPEEILQRLPATFARYDAADIGRALLEMTTLFRDLATRLGRHHGFDYPDESHERTVAWASQHISQITP
jgi:aminoglycoside 6-adenylyltransferase